MDVSGSDTERGEYSSDEETFKIITVRLCNIVNADMDWLAMLISCLIEEKE